MKRSSFFGINLIFLTLASIGSAQFIPIGFYEGLMGNSGLAISDSTAGSYYNPSLITYKNKNSYSLGGNTFSNFRTNADDASLKISSSKMGPSYLSSLQVFDHFVHEFFLVNTASLDSQTKSITQPGAEITNNIRIENYQMGYTFGFPSLPMGFQTALRFQEIQNNGFYEFQDALTTVTSNLKGSSRTVDLILSMGGAHQFGNYRFGYKYSTRGLAIYKKKEGLAKTYTYVPLSNQYQKTESTYNIEQKPSGDAVAIGHGFKMNDHEFLTDSKFEEASDLTHTYSWTQTFGYKLSSNSGYQYMCGISHLINQNIKYFGQSMYLSTGFSWLTKTYRSALGPYYHIDNLSSETQAYGLTFSSEFTY